MKRAVTVATAAVALAVPAAAEAGDRAGLSFRFAERAPGVPTAATAHLVYKPAPGHSKPSPIRRVVIDLPRGTRVRRGLPRCTATDAELRAIGRGACEQGSLVGQGRLTAVTGFGPPFDPFPTDLWLYNSPEGLLELVQADGRDATIAVERGTMTGTRIVFQPPTTPGGPPDGETAVSEIHWQIAGGRNAWLTTPRSCPAEGSWRATGTFTFADGVTARESSRTPCRAL